MTSEQAQRAAAEAAAAAQEAEAAAQAARAKADALAEAAREADDIDETEDPETRRAEAEAQAKEAAAREKAAEADRHTGEPGEPGGASETAEEPSAIVAAVQQGYAFEGAALELGALVDGEAVAEAPVRIPLGMLNRHALVAGATGTGKTKTLQVMAEQIAAQGVPVFAADIKGDLSGIAVPGEPSEALDERCASIGQTWQPTATPTEFFTLGGLGTGVPIRASVESFGPTMLAKVLGLNATQESSLGLVFHYAKESGSRLVDLADLRAVLTYLTTDGKDELKKLGGLSSSTAGVILRELIAFGDAGADVFFGLPEIDPADFLRTTDDGRGIVSLLEVPSVQEKPAVFSTFLMYLLAALFRTLPEVGDPEKPTLVFFFDEAHLLFADASDDFLEVITQTVRLIRSKGVGIVFVTQTPRDVPSDVLAQLGSRVQHQLRAHTPDAAKALKATVSTYPHSDYDLEEVLTQLSIGEAIVTVMNEKGAPSPVAWTRLRAPQGSMTPAPESTIETAVQGSPLMATYGTAENPESASEVLARRAEARQAEADARTEAERTAKEAEQLATTSGGSSSRSSSRSSRRDSTVEKVAKEAGRTLARELVKSIFRRR